MTRLIYTVEFQSNVPDKKNLRGHPRRPPIRRAFISLIYVDVRCNMAGVKKISPINWGKGEWIFGGNNFSPIIIIIRRKRVHSGLKKKR